MKLLPGEQEYLYLIKQIGPKMTSYILSIDNPDNLPGYNTLSQDQRLVLGQAYRVLYCIIERYDNTTAKSWLFGTNSHLDNNAPAQALRYRKISLEQIEAAAKSL